ncbi:MAG TPA: nucleoside kinase [bacterium]|nr:nucleoside kinase [bacterium]HPJ71243.1 nucleoside kinase [bacterium]HPQ65828.1 nucleoside kinase [bacterium]
MDAQYIQNIPMQVIEGTLTWNREQNVDTVQGLNRRIAEGSFADLVKASDERYHWFTRTAAEAIINSPKPIRLVIIAGPSSSGKTTATIKISERLKEKGLELVPMVLDNYFFDLEMHPKDEYGDYDFETPQALDLPLINKHLGDLLAGKEIRMPIYSFKTGKRLQETVPLKLSENEIVLIDSLHGLYEPMTSSVPAANKFRLYIETLSQLKDVHGEWTRWTDIRLLRRMIRDSWHRSYSPVRTIGHWHYVRRSEMKHIVPFITETDFVVNGALAYELPIHKKYSFAALKEAMDEFKDDPGKQDAYIRARRVYELLDTITVVEDDSCIPGKSPLREFIGGSEYSY